MTWQTWQDVGLGECPMCGDLAEIEGEYDGAPGSSDPGDDVAFEPLPSGRCAKCVEAIESANIRKGPHGWILDDPEGDEFPYVWTSYEQAEEFACKELRL